MSSISPCDEDPRQEEDKVQHHVGEKVPQLDCEGTGRVTDWSPPFPSRSRLSAGGPRPAQVVGIIVVDQLLYVS